MNAENPGTRLTIRKLLSARREDVYDAWLDPESLAEWMRPNDGIRSTVEVDPRVGGAFRIVMRHSGGEYDHRGEYLVLDRPSKIVFTWISDGTGQRESIVTIELHARGDETELVLTHEGLPDGESARRHTEGWSGIASALAEHFARP
jgi:uncharacterized protein YndB with AHSA1/START domain